MKSLNLEVDNSSASQEINWLSWNTNIHYWVHKSTPLLPILSQMNLVYILSHNLHKTPLILSSQLRVRTEPEYKDS
jgi:hypothetical protein